MVWLVRKEWNPFKELETLQDVFRREMGHLFPWTEERRPLSGMGAFPAINLKSQPTGVTLTAELPGLEEKDLNISVDGNRLVLSGKRDAEKLSEGEEYYCRERFIGEFTRLVELPYRVDAEKVDARLDKGVLTVTLQPCEQDKVKKIPIRGS